MYRQHARARSLAERQTNHAPTRGNPTHHNATRTTTPHREMRTRADTAESIVCDTAHSERINYPKTRGDTYGRRITTRQETKREHRTKNDNSGDALRRAKETTTRREGKQMGAGTP